MFVALLCLNIVFIFLVATVVSRRLFGFFVSAIFVSSILRAVYTNVSGRLSHFSLTSKAVEGQKEE